MGLSLRSARRANLLKRNGDPGSNSYQVNRHLPALKFGTELENKFREVYNCSEFANPPSLFLSFLLFDSLVATVKERTRSLIDRLRDTMYSENPFLSLLSVSRIVANRRLLASPSFCLKNIIQATTANMNVLKSTARSIVHCLTQSAYSEYRTT